MSSGRLLFLILCRRSAPGRSTDAGEAAPPRVTVTTTGPLASAAQAAPGRVAPYRFFLFRLSRRSIPTDLPALRDGIALLS